MSCVEVMISPNNFLHDFLHEATSAALIPALVCFSKPILVICSPEFDNTSVTRTQKDMRRDDFYNVEFVIDICQFGSS